MEPVSLIKYFHLLKDVFKYEIIKYLDNDDISRLLEINTDSDVDLIIFLGISVRYNDDYAIKRASHRGNLSVVQKLVERVPLKIALLKMRLLVDIFLLYST